MSENRTKFKLREVVEKHEVKCPGHHCVNIVQVTETRRPARSYRDWGTDTRILGKLCDPCWDEAIEIEV